MHVRLSGWSHWKVVRSLAASRWALSSAMVNGLPTRAAAKAIDFHTAIANPAQLITGRRGGRQAARRGDADHDQLGFDLHPSREEGERHLEVRVGNVETTAGRRQVFAAVGQSSQVSQRGGVRIVTVASTDIPGPIMPAGMPSKSSIRIFTGTR